MSHLLRSVSLMGRWESLSELDVGSLGLVEAEAALAATCRLSAEVGKLQNRLAAQVASFGAPVEPVVRANSACTNREARQAAARGSAIADQPALGELPSSHVDAAARAASDLSHAERREFFDQAPAVADTCATPEASQRRLVKLADSVRRQSKSDRLEAQRAAVKASRGRTDSGMCWLYGEFDPETGAQVFAAWDAAIARRAKQSNGSHGAHTMGLALADLILSGSGDRPGAEVNLLIDAHTLAGYEHDGSVSETYDGDPMPPTVIERLGCIANLAVQVINEHGTVINHGRGRRLPSKQQRHWLRATYAGCGWPGCDAPWSACEIHHVTFWRHLGSTDIDNLLPRCRRHHHDIHDRGWHLTLKPDRSIEIRDPRGRVQTHGPPEPIYRPPRSSPEATAAWGPTAGPGPQARTGVAHSAGWPTAIR